MSQLGRLRGLVLGNRTHDSKLLFTALTVLVCSSFVSSPAHARISRMPFAIGGQRENRPQWQDASQDEITSVSIDFRAYAQARDRVAVDSQAIRASLKFASSYPVSTKLTLPSGCSVGTARVNDRHVRLLTNASGSFAEYQNGPLTIANDALHSFVLRFTDNALLGLRSGGVLCASDGAISFSY